MAELPVINAAVNFVIDMSALPISAAMMTLVEPEAIEFFLEIKLGKLALGYAVQC